MHLTSGPERRHIVAQGKAPTFACAACGARYPWKPQFAGKKVKCKCGMSVPIPAENPTAPARPAPAARPAAPARAAAVAAPAPTVGGSEPQDDGMYDFADDPKPARAVAAPVVPGLPSASIPTAVKTARSAAAA